MNLETSYFKSDFRYRIKFVNKCITIIRYSSNEKRKKAYRNLLFKMMKDIVKKNISNFLNLINSIDGILQENIPSRDELLSDCYVIFDKCIEKYLISPTNNFYFYFNKSLSRNFYKEYRQYLRRSVNTEITESLTTASPVFHQKTRDNSVELLLYHMGLTDFEMKVARSRLRGQRSSEFLKENTDVTSAQYTRALKRMKEILIEFKESGDL